MINLTTLNYYRMNVSVQKRYRKEIGEPGEKGCNIPDEWLVHYIAERQEQKEKEKPANKRLLEFQQRLNEYRNAYEVSAPNDLSDLENLVKLQMQSEDLDRRLEQLKDRVDEKEAKLASIINADKKTILSGISDIQARLGIGRSTREKLRQDKSGSQVIMETVEDAMDWLQGEIKQYVCPRCHSLTGWFWQLSGISAPHSVHFCCPCQQEIIDREGL